jgi:hypothetical protein
MRDRRRTLLAGMLVVLERVVEMISDLGEYACAFPAPNVKPR